MVDANGLMVLDATPPVTVAVEGAGKLVGLDTGDLSYQGCFKAGTRAAYQGRLLATVQRTTPLGELRLTASAATLAPATETQASSK